jgi:hypothetical protein
MAHWSDEKLIDAAREGHVPKLRDLLFLRGANIEVKDGVRVGCATSCVEASCLTGLCTGWTHAAP